MLILLNDMILNGDDDEDEDEDDDDDDIGLTDSLSHWCWQQEGGRAQSHCRKQGTADDDHHHGDHIDDDLGGHNEDDYHQHCHVPMLMT